MIEIYLFVNPIGTECYQAEEQILKLVKAEQRKKIQFRFVPFVNMYSVDLLLQRHHILSTNLDKRNEIFQALYSAALDFKALELQGKKKGQRFLLRLQEACGFQGKTYKKSLVENLVVSVGGDLDEFRKDRQSSIVKEAFFTDQRIARDMNVELSPSCVIYNYSSEEDFGVLVEGPLCKELVTLQNLCKSGQEKLKEHQVGFSDDSFSQRLHLL